jgi:hypothetical protein
LEYEAALSWGYLLHQWQHETVVNRAKCVAHYLHKTMRDGYIQETMMSKAKAKGGKKTKSQQGFKSLMGAFGIRS